MPRGDLETPDAWSSLGNIGRGVLDAMFGGPDPARRRPSHGGKEIVADEAIRRYREGVTPTSYPVELYDYDPVKPFESLPTHDEEGDKQRREQIEVAMPIALSAAGSGIPFAKPSPSTLGIFVGRSARGVDRAALKRAEEMEAKGVDRDAIWKETGWGRTSKSGDWITEISDHAAKTRRGVGSWADLIEHPDYFRALPQTLEHRATIGPGAASGYFEGDKLVAYGKTPGQMTNVTLHEMQHGASGATGLSRGGAPDSPKFQEFAQGHREAAMRQYEDLVRDLHAYQGAWAARKGVDPDGFQTRQYHREMKAATEQWRKEFPDRAAAMDRAVDDAMHLSNKRAYHVLEDETRARNVQRRQYMTPEQRRNKPPWKTQDVPDEQQIVRYLDDSEASVATKPTRSVVQAPAEASKPFLRALEDRIEQAVKELGLSRKEVLKRFIKGDMQ